MENSSDRKSYFIGFGIAMVINPFTMIKYTVIFAGCVMLANGVVDFVFLVLIRRGMKKAEEAVEEAVEQMKEAEIKAEESEAGRETEMEPEYTAWSDRRTVLEQKSEKRMSRKIRKQQVSGRKIQNRLFQMQKNITENRQKKNQKRNDLIQKY